MACQRCGSVQVTPEAIVQLLRAAAPDVRLRTGGVIAFPRGLGAPQRRCPDCGDEMMAGVLFEVPVDQCASHGIWFERHGLGVMLDNARARYDERSKK
jgi:hypothetical protein